MTLLVNAGEAIEGEGTLAITKVRDNGFVYGGPGAKKTLG